MSNETDLDWLARNVHVWAEDWTHVRKCPVHHEAKWMASLSPNAEYKDWRTKQQWLARRAELQNNPSWEDAPDWARWLAKDSPDKDEESAWWWYADKPVAMKNTWQVSTDVRAWMAASCHCDLGDWRDTLEKRPEQNEFEPFVSVEDNQEQVMTNHQDMKQDNRWFERGELPPVGVVCEAYIDYPPQWVEAEIVAHKDGFAIGWCKSVMKGCHGDKASEFRPIRTEREVLISVIIDEMNRYDTDAKLADAILAAGFKLEVK
jgi:hypothetical protein